MRYMKKIFLYAYDETNLGDDLFIRTIASRYSNVKIYFWTNKNNKKIFNDIKNLRILDKDNRLMKILTRFWPSVIVRYQEMYKKRSDAVVYIGGSIFIEYPTWKDIVNWWKYQVDSYKVYCVGANFGPYENDEYRKSMSEIFSEVQDICFRDSYSVSLFKNINNVRCAPDILFSYDMPEIPLKAKQVFISVINCKVKEGGSLARNRENYEKGIQSYIEMFLKKGYEIVIASFCKDEGDEEVTDQYENIYKNNKKVKILNYNGYNYKKLLHELANSEYVIATRFHAMILGMVAKCKVIPIIYSDKSKNVLYDLGIKDGIRDLRRLNEINLQMDGNVIIFDNEFIKELKRKSEKHFLKLDMILK